MQTQISAEYKQHKDITEADAILRSCVHCGFCTATCPTYQLLGDELDSPRGRIHLIKQTLEGHEPGRKTQLHLDRCLTCRACETTCPSGVEYGRLLEIGREIINEKVKRPLSERLQRKLLLQLLPYQTRVAPLLKIARIIRPLLPASIKHKIPTAVVTQVHTKSQHSRTMLVLKGCVQPLMKPNTDIAAANVLNKIGINLITVSDSGCCGAISQHLSDTDVARTQMKRNIDALWPYVENSAEAIISTASGCGVMLKEYGTLLKDDPQYRDKAQRISELTKDISEIVSNEDFSAFGTPGHGIKVALQTPCTLQHGQKLNGIIENILSTCGYELTNIPDSHLCCGSAGTYSILQQELSQQLLNNKLDALISGTPDIIASANIGCQLHIETKANIPVKHWIELLDSND